MSFARVIIEEVAVLVALGLFLATLALWVDIIGTAVR